MQPHTLFPYVVANSDQSSLLRHFASLSGPYSSDLDKRPIGPQIVSTEDRATSLWIGLETLSRWTLSDLIADACTHANRYKCDKLLTTKVIVMRSVSRVGYHWPRCCYKLNPVGVVMGEGPRYQMRSSTTDSQYDRADLCRINNSRRPQILS